MQLRGILHLPLGKSDVMWENRGAVTLMLATGEVSLLRPCRTLSSSVCRSTTNGTSWLALDVET